MFARQVYDAPRTTRRLTATLTGSQVKIDFLSISPRRTVVTTKYLPIYSLLFFLGSLLWFVSSASAQSCTPVVYAFRHAEDSGRNLTLVGRQHASLYPSMVAGFGSSHSYCPVGFVYSMYEFNADGSPGTNNPFQTAQPLAAFVCGDAAFFAGLDPYTTCCCAEN